MFENECYDCNHIWFTTIVPTVCPECESENIDTDIIDEGEFENEKD